ncbi:hypothetical protein Tco_0923087 [Tanacetum coccineum]|uniref:Uncharacterized protein n=1 Tax=Tanacetum coccineum TaxID=301880 RepID=A0ABQ5D395_9ASTR
MRSLQMDVDDEIFNLVDLHIGILGGEWKLQDIQSLLWLDHHKNLNEWKMVEKNRQACIIPSEVKMSTQTPYIGASPRSDGFAESFFKGFAAALAVLVTGASQSRQHESHHRFFPVDTSLIHIESRKSPTKSLFDVGSRRISIFTVNTKEYHSDVLAIITRIMLLPELHELELVGIIPALAPSQSDFFPYFSLFTPFFQSYLGLLLYLMDCSWVYPSGSGLDHGTN